MDSLVKKMDDQQIRLKDSASWRRLRGWLTGQESSIPRHDPNAIPGVVPGDALLSVFAPWMQRVARFSFELGRS